MIRSPGFRLIIVALLTLLMSVPLFFAGVIIDARSSYNNSAINTVSLEWGGRQILGAPMVMVPVTQEVLKERLVEVIDPITNEVAIDAETGVERRKMVSQLVTETLDPLFVNADSMQVSVSSMLEERHRGLFNVPVYKAIAQMTFDFSYDEALSEVPDDAVLQWDQAELWLQVKRSQSLRGVAKLTVDGNEVVLTPLEAPQKTRDGLSALLGDPRDIRQFQLDLGFNGAQSLHLTPAARNSVFDVQSNWPHPSFTGAFLPDDSEISEAGFSAQWSIPYLATGVPKFSRINPDQTGITSDVEFGVRFFQPSDFYTKAFRATTYAILFVALTFLTVFLIENTTNQRTHPVQYGMIGLAQTLFLILMVSLAEQIGFNLAYLVSAAATTALITSYGWFGLKLGTKTVVLGTTLLVIYTVLYFILQASDYALLAGSSLCFAALAIAMYATRNTHWYGEERPREELVEQPVHVPSSEEG